jgi:hypothetical protein
VADYDVTGSIVIRKLLSDLGSAQGKRAWDKDLVEAHEVAQLLNQGYVEKARYLFEGRLSMLEVVGPE